MKHFPNFPNRVKESIWKVCKNLRGKSQKEIAESLNISVNTVKKHINNANHYLKKRLDKLFLLLSLLH